MKNNIQLLFSIILLLIIGGLVFYFSNTNPKYEVLETKSETSTTTETNIATTTEIKKNNEINMNDKTTVILKTNQGDIKMELFKDKAPKTVENFTKLASSGFYNGVRFHRVIKDFMIQSGDPLTKDIANKMYWGTGDPGYKFSDEFGVGLSNVSGTISMANSGPNTNGSQFFINTNDNTFLDGKHAVFGKVVEGMNIIDKIENAITGPNDVPVEDVIINSVEVY